MTTRVNVGFTLSFVKLLLSSLKLYMQFDFMVYQQIVGIATGTNCAPLIADLFLYVMSGIPYQTFINPNALTSSTLTSLTIPLDIFTIYLQLMTLNLLNIFLIYIVGCPNFDSGLISIGELFLTADFLRWRRCWQYFHHRRSVLWFLHWEVYRPINASWCDVHTFDLLHTLFDAILANAFSSKCSRASK